MFFEKLSFCLVFVCLVEQIYTGITQFQIFFKLFLNYFSGVICATCRYWRKKNEKHKEMLGIVFTSNIGICQNVAAMDQILLIPNDNAINIIPHATIETDEGFGCIHFRPHDFSGTI